LCKPAIALTYFGTPKLPDAIDLWVTGAALVGTLLGQVFFGLMGDRFGRKSIYLVTLLIMIVATIGQCTSASTVRGASFYVWLVLWRLLLGMGVGGEYPLSATIAAEFSNRHNRGALVACVFSMQGIGILFASLVAIGVFGGMKRAIIADILNLDWCWRIMLGLGVLPALATMYLREQMPETPHYRREEAARKAEAAAAAGGGGGEIGGAAGGGAPAATNTLNDRIFAASKSRGAGAKTLTEYLTAPTVWTNRNFWVLVGTTMTWFLLDVAFYSQNLFLPDLLRSTGFSSFPEIPDGGAAACVGECAEAVWRGVFRSAVGNAFVAIVALVPG
jgi:MFS transporter, PHS family, inorganic phosphate transporter